MKRLSNGIPLIHNHVPSAHRCAVYVGIKGGPVEESDGLLGISHLTEHMLFTSSKMMKAQELIRCLEWHGIDANASTDYTDIRLHMNIPLEHLQYGLGLIKSMLIESEYVPMEFEKERRVVFEELRSYRNQPAEYLLFWFLEPRLMHGTPLSRNLLGTESSVKQMTFDDVVSWKRKLFVPDRFVFSVAGNIDEAAAFSVVDGVFGSLSVVKSGFTRQSYVPQPMVGQHQVRKKGIDQAYVHRGYLVPTLMDAEYPATLLLYYIMDGGMSSRTFQELRERRSLGYCAGMKYCKEHGFWLFCVDGCDVDKVKSAYAGFDDVVGGLSHIGADELEGMRTLLLTHIREKLLCEEDVSRNALNAVLFENALTYAQLVERIMRVTVEDVYAVAQKIFAQKPVDVHLMPD